MLCFSPCLLMMWVTVLLASLIYVYSLISISDVGYSCISISISGVGYSCISISISISDVGLDLNYDWISMSDDLAEIVLAYCASRIS